MREETTTRILYEFDELSDEAQQVARQQLWDINVCFDWWDATYEDAARIGLKLTEFDLGRRAYCRGEWIDDPETVARAILAEHGDQCETYKTAQAFLVDVTTGQEKHKSSPDYDPDYEEYWETQEYENRCDEFLHDLLEDYRIILQNEYDYLTSEEAIREIIEANEYEFTENGKLA